MHSLPSFFLRWIGYHSSLLKGRGFRRNIWKYTLRARNICPPKTSITIVMSLKETFQCSRSRPLCSQRFLGFLKKCSLRPKRLLCTRAPQCKDHFTVKRCGYRESTGRQVSQRTNFVIDKLSVNITSHGSLVGWFACVLFSLGGGGGGRGILGDPGAASRDDAIFSG